VVHLVDTHCHILPHLDDGPENMVEAIAMAKLAVDNGIHTVIATPHHAKRFYNNPSTVIRRNVENFNRQLMDENIPLRVLAGQEYALNDRFRDEYQAGRMQTLGESRYILVELPAASVPKSFGALVEHLFDYGLTPVVAHPERNLQFLQHPGQLYDWVLRGVLLQITSPSVIGMFGRRVQELSILMCRQQWAHLLASDAHNTQKRPIRLRESYAHIHEEIGFTTAEALSTNASRLAMGLRIEGGEPIPLQKRKRFWIV
jgi:protein-tyrosine phosphatase